MWAIRVLNGPLAGQTFPLPQGKVKIGRAQSCQVQISGPGISKEHVEITVYPDKMLINDLRSSNGTFLNGIRIQGGFLKVGDKIMVSQVLFDIVLLQEHTHPTRSLQPVHSQPPQAYHGQVPVAGGYGYQHDQLMASAPPAANPANFGGFFAYQSYRFNQYMETVALPGIYRLPKIFDSVLS